MQIQKGQIISGKMIADSDFILTFTALVKYIGHRGDNAFSACLVLRTATGTFHEPGDILHYSPEHTFLKWEFIDNNGSVVDCLTPERELVDIHK